MLGVALTSGLQPWGAAVAGAVLPADIAQDAAAAHLVVDRINPYGPVIRDAQADLTGLPIEATFPHFPHPPFSMVVSLPLGFVSYRSGAMVWFAFTIALLFGLAALLNAAVHHRESPKRSTGVLWFFALLLLWPPVLYNLEKGQWSVPLTILLTIGWHALAAGRLRAAAMWTGAAAALKVFPLVIGGFFLLRYVRATAWFVATAVVLTSIPLVWLGFTAFGDFVRESRMNMPYWESYPLVMLSIHGALARLFVGGQWARPLVHAPVAATVIEVALVVGLLGLVTWITVRTTRHRVDHSLTFCAWVVLLPMLNPQSLGHNAVLLALPLVVVGRALAHDGAHLHRWAWAMALALISVPKQTVWRYASPPVGPLEGIAISALPTWGALLLFVLTVVLAQSAVRAALLAREAAASGRIVALPSHQP